MKVCGVPGQLLAVGVTVIFAVCTVVPEFVALKLVMSVLPEAARPIEVLSLVQLNTVPATVPVKFTAVVAALLQSTWSAGSATVGVGFTTTVTVSVAVQPLSVAVAVYNKVPTAGVKLIPSVTPLSHVITAPVGLDAVKVTAVPSQTICLLPASTVGALGDTKTSLPPTKVQVPRPESVMLL